MVRSRTSSDRHKTAAEQTSDAVAHAAQQQAAAANAHAAQQQAAAAEAAAAENGGTVEKCVNCQYYDRRRARPTDGKAPMWGQCRKHSPHLNPVTAKAYVVEGVWPLVRDDDWCGEWEVLTRMIEAPLSETVAPASEEAAAPAPPQQRSDSATVVAPVAAGDD